MIPLKRREKILQKLNGQNIVKVKDLAAEFEVSETTIRRDLSALEEKGIIVRDYGGAIKVDQDSTAFEPPYDLKKNEHPEEKRKIGRLAASFIKQGDTIILDSGSTTLEVAKAINPDLSLTVVTNDLKVAMVIVEKPNMELIVLGGKHRKGVYTLQGNIAERTVADFKVNRTFLGADALDERGVSNVNTEEVPLKQLMVKAGEKVTVVTDHSKFGKRAFANVCNLKEIDSMITDTLPPDKILKKYEEEEVEIITS